MWAIYCQLEVIQNGQHYIVWKIWSLYNTFKTAHYDRTQVYDGEYHRLGFALPEEIEAYIRFGGNEIYG